MYLARETTHLSLAEIGAWFNHDHTTVMHGVPINVTNRQQNDDLREELEKIMRLLSKRWNTRDFSGMQRASRQAIVLRSARD